jgi:hypothetical protein
MPNDVVRMREILFFVPRDEGYTDFLSFASYSMKMLEYRGAAKGGCRAPAPPNQNLRSTDYVDTISTVLRDLPFWKSATEIE